MPPSGMDRINDWHNAWPGHADMYLVPSICSYPGQNLINHCSSTSCSGGFTCRADFYCPTGEIPVKGICPGNVVSYPKNLGRPSECIGNPCNPATGNKYQREIDYSGAATGLSFVRHYNSQLGHVDQGLGYGWTHRFAPSLQVSPSQVVVHQSDGRAESFHRVNGTWQGDADSHLQLTRDGSGYALTGITDENGDHYARFAYNASGQAILTEHAVTSNSQAQEHFELCYDSCHPDHGHRCHWHGGGADLRRKPGHQTPDQPDSAGRPQGHPPGL